MDCPCKDSSSRNILCHSNCELYKKWVKEHIEKNKEIKEKIRFENFLDTQEIKRSKRKQKKRGR